MTLSDELKALQRIAAFRQEKPSVPEAAFSTAWSLTDTKFEGKLWLDYVWHLIAADCQVIATRGERASIKVIRYLADTPGFFISRIEALKHTRHSRYAQAWEIAPSDLQTAGILTLRKMLKGYLQDVSGGQLLVLPDDLKLVATDMCWNNKTQVLDES